VLAGLFLASAVAAGTAALLVLLPLRCHAGPASRWQAAVTGLMVSASGPGALAAGGSPPSIIALAAFLLAAANLLWLPLTRSWNSRGHAAWAATTVFTVSYLAYMLAATFRAGLGPLGTAGGLVLWLLELVSFALGFAYLWEVLDILCRRRWTRRLPQGFTGAADDRHATPFVSLHVPAHNEPPEMVIETLRSLLALDYPAFEIVMIDDNTDDPALWQPVQRFCENNGITFAHLRDWPGYKSGALNYALTITDPRAEIIGVIDADYLVDADYLARCAPLFSDPRLAFVQTPQNYREWQHSAYFRRLFASYEYFFTVSQISRNEQNAAIFGGTWD